MPSPMSLFKRFGFGPDKAKGQPKQKEQEIVFEEVPDEGEDFTYKEDPVEAMVGKILSLEADLDAARDALEEGTGDEASVSVREVLLAKARYEQASANERVGRGKKGETNRLLQEWQQAQNGLDALHEDRLQNAREAVSARYEDDDIDADTAAQLRRHA